MDLIIFLFAFIIGFFIGPAPYFLFKLIKKYLRIKLLNKYIEFLKEELTDLPYLEYTNCSRKNNYPVDNFSIIITKVSPDKRVMDAIGKLYDKLIDKGIDLPNIITFEGKK